MANKSRTTIGTGVTVTELDWTLIQAYGMFEDAPGLGFLGMRFRMSGREQEVWALEDLIHILAQRHGLPDLPAGGYEINCDTREFVVDERHWETWKKEVIV